MLVLKYAFSLDIQDRLEVLFRLLGELLEIEEGKDYWITTMIYLMTGATGIGLDTLKETASRMVSPEKGEEIMTIAEKLIRQGEERGIQKGEKQGEIKRARQSVLEVLEVRFGEIPWDIRADIYRIDNLSFLELLLKESIRSKDLEAFRSVLEQK